MKKSAMFCILLMTFMVACGGKDSSSDVNSSSAISNASLSDEVSVDEVLSESINVSVNESVNDSSTQEEPPLYPSSSYFYNFTTFNKVVNYKAGTEDFGKSGYNWSFSSYQNQGSKFYLGSNGRFGNSELFGLTEENGFLPLLDPSTYGESDITYGMKMDFDILGISEFTLEWDNRSAEVDVTILYSLDSGETWLKGTSEAFTGMIPVTGYTLPGSITLTQTFASRVRLAVVCKALSTTSDGGSTLNLTSVTIE